MMIWPASPCRGMLPTKKRKTTKRIKNDQKNPKIVKRLKSA